MYVDNKYSIYVNKFIKYLGIDDARRYRDEIQKKIDEDFDSTIDIDIIQYRSGQCGLHLSGSLDFYNEESMERICHELEELDTKLDDIIEVFGLYDKIES